MSRRATGRYEPTTVGGEEVAAFVPHALPPADPPIVVDAALAERLRAAEQALVRLELAGDVTVASVMKLVDTTKPTAGRAIELLVTAGVLVETTGRKRDRSFVYRSYLDRLRAGTELGGARVPGR